MLFLNSFFFFFSSRRRHTRWPRDWSSDVCSSDLKIKDFSEFRRKECSDEFNAHLFVRHERLHEVIPDMKNIATHERKIRNLCQFFLHLNFYQIFKKKIINQKYKKTKKIKYTEIIK